MRPTGKSPKPGFPETSSVPVFPFSFRTTSERQTTSGSSSSPATSICFSNLRTNCFERSVRIWSIPGKRMSRFLVISSERLRTFDPSWARSTIRRPRRTWPRWKFATTSWDKRSRQSYLEKRLYLRIFNFELNLFWSHLYCFFYAANKKKASKMFLWPLLQKLDFENKWFCFGCIFENLFCSERRKTQIGFQAAKFVSTSSVSLKLDRRARRQLLGVQLNRPAACWYPVVGGPVEPCW